MSGLYTVEYFTHNPDNTVTTTREVVPADSTAAILHRASARAMEEGWPPGGGWTWPEHPGD